MQSKLNKLTSFLGCFCGRYEYREMHKILKDVNDGKDVLPNLEKLKSVLQKFQCTSVLEIDQRKEALAQLEIIINILTKSSENVQPSKTVADVRETEDGRNSEASDVESTTDGKEINVSKAK